MEKTISGNESLQRLRIIKDHNSTSAASLSGKMCQYRKAKFIR
jgi:hypothetical protein